MTEPMVTAFMMTYNRPLFVEKALLLYKKQTYPNKELLLIDDGPEGTVPSVLPPGVRHIKVKRAWLPEKRSIAFDNAKGSMICGWDDDDYFGEHRLERQVRTIMAGADACGFAIDYMAILPDLHFRRWQQNPYRSIKFHDGTAMFKMSALGSLPAQMRFQLGYYDILLEMKQRGMKLVEIPNHGDFLYLRHPSSVWQVNWKEFSKVVGPPSWLPVHMLEFWGRPELLLQGKGGGCGPAYEDRKKQDA